MMSLWKYLYLSTLTTAVPPLVVAHYQLACQWFWEDQGPCHLKSAEAEVWSLGEVVVEAAEAAVVPSLGEDRLFELAAGDRLSALAPVFAEAQSLTISTLTCARGQSTRCHCQQQR